MQHLTYKQRGRFVIAYALGEYVGYHTCATSANAKAIADWFNSFQ